MYEARHHAPVVVAPGAFLGEPDVDSQREDQACEDGQRADGREDVWRIVDEDGHGKL